MIEQLSSRSIPMQQRITTTDGIQEPVLQQNKANKEEYIKDSSVKRDGVKEQVEDVLKGLNEFLLPSHTSLKFEFHEKLNQYYVSVIDDSTKEVVREIPAKKLLDTYAAMREFLGLMIDKKI
jgi:flagellar protein FlaG